MANETALIRPVVDALLALLRAGEQHRLKRNARAAVSEAIRELLAADPDTRRAEARIAIAKAAGILSEDVLLAEDLLARQRSAAPRRSPSARSARAKAGSTDDAHARTTSPAAAKSPSARSGAAKASTGKSAAARKRAPKRR